MGRSYVGENNKFRIIEFLSTLYPNGSTISELKNNLQIHRDTIQSHCKQLISMGYVRKEGGHRGKYHVTPKAFGNPATVGFLFGVMAIDVVNKSISIENKFNRQENIKFAKGSGTITISKYAYTNEELSLYLFASKIGILITYTLLQALRHASGSSIVDTGNKNQRGERQLDIMGSHRDEMAIEWIKNSIKPEMIFWKFIQLPMIADCLALWRHVRPRRMSLEMQKRIISVQSKRRKANPKDKNWSPYQVEENNFDNLMKSFKNNWPQFYQELESCREWAHLELEGHRKKMELQKK